MTVKTLIRALECIRARYDECCLNLRRVRDEISELEKRNKPVDISLKSKECELTDKVSLISATIDELLDAEIK